MKQRSLGWERYERLIARLIADQASTALCVTPNARIVGKISGRSRQIDVVMDLRHDSDNSRRVIVDAKKRTRKIDVTHVEALRGLMEDVGATHGYLVCPVGHTKAAERRAQGHVSIRLVPLERLDQFDPSTWPQCLNADCAQGRVFWDGYPEFTTALQPLSGVAPTNSRAAFLHYVGKCDRCGRFHVKCLTCADLFDLREVINSDERRCRCGLPWFWLASVEKDEYGKRSAELHVVLIGPNEVITVDRRPF